MVADGEQQTMTSARDRERGQKQRQHQCGVSKRNSPCTVKSVYRPLLLMVCAWALQENALTEWALLLHLTARIHAIRPWDVSAFPVMPLFWFWSDSVRFSSMSLEAINPCRPQHRPILVSASLCLSLSLSRGLSLLYFHYIFRSFSPSFLFAPLSS
jgi:hypothetical protein